MRDFDRLSFQLYSARFLEPVEAVFDLLAGLGYRHAEPFGGLLGDPDRLRRVAETRGIALPTIHCGLDRLRDDAATTTRLCASLGVKTVIVPAPPNGERDKDEAGWRAFGRELHEIGKAVRDQGLGFAYHNHHWEYGRAVSGRYFLDVMFDEAPDMGWEPDLAWIARGGADPVAELRRPKDRVIAVHIKDLAPAGECADEDGWADVGFGTMDWTALRDAIAGTGARYLVAEHDKPNDVARFTRRTVETVKDWQ